MKTFLRNNGLSLFLFGAFITFQIALSAVGYHQYNQEQAKHRQAAMGYLEYLHSAHFMEATMENWESEFLQMFAYVLFTAFLFQKGAADSKDPDRPAEVDRDPRLCSNKKNAPWPVKKGGILLGLYEYSLRRV